MRPRCAALQRHLALDALRTAIHVWVVCPYRLARRQETDTDAWMHQELGGLVVVVVQQTFQARWCRGNASSLGRPGARAIQRDASDGCMDVAYMYMLYTHDVLPVGSFRSVMMGSRASPNEAQGNQTCDMAGLREAIPWQRRPPPTTSYVFRTCLYLSSPCVDLCRLVWASSSLG
ncbi:hypothetical protein G6O67_000686 [Ophiocordyceps sinensis]|uniref:Uncharacterized protein n=1 Tax=Ophiocordyceps sinensis TaxID=72228 RepID=A0A8H4PZR3_9HYPO|nr:hypothetical protein G6O67_000686 [Ophiocordyceps sinensis]